MKLLHDRSTYDEITRRLGVLRAESERLWGKMTVDQMLWHCGAALRTGLGEMECAPLDNVLKRTVLKWLVLRLPWPRGKAPTAPEMVAPDRYVFAAERDVLLATLERFASKPLDSAWARHPAFGALDGREWSWLQYRHLDHHLTQFGV